MTTSRSPFDPIAGLYHRHWYDWYLPAALPALESLFFSRLDAQATVLDVCCGCGHVTAELLRRGFRVTGVDTSAALLEIAQRSMPQVDWQRQDVRSMRFPCAFHAALSTFDSLNHLLHLRDLQSAFDCVRKALRNGGLFVFDMNLREAFCVDMHNWSVSMTDTDVSLMRGTFDEQTSIARTELVWFERRDSHWERSESVIEETCYTQREIVDALTNAGFHAIECLPARQAGMHSEIGFGRMFFTALS